MASPEDPLLPKPDSELQYSLNNLQKFLTLLGFCHNTFLHTTLSCLAFFLLAVALPLLRTQLSKCSRCEKLEIQTFEVEILVSRAVVAAVSLSCVSRNLRKYGIRKALCTLFPDPTSLQSCSLKMKAISASVGVTSERKGLSEAMLAVCEQVCCFLNSNHQFALMQFHIPGLPRHVPPCLLLHLLESHRLLNHAQARLVLKNKLAQMISHIDQEKQQYKAEKEICDQVLEELNNIKRKALLLESVLKESMELQELGRQTSDLEEKCAAFGDELQKRFVCSECNQDNSAELGDCTQPNDG